jgi:hypothetical protein
MTTGTADEVFHDVDGNRGTDTPLYRCVHEFERVGGEGTVGTNARPATTRFPANHGGQHRQTPSTRAWLRLLLLAF